jgi:hypothetical protein
MLASCGKLYSNGCELMELTGDCRQKLAEQLLLLFAVHCIVAACNKGPTELFVVSGEARGFIARGGG